MRSKTKYISVIILQMISIAFLFLPTISDVKIYDSSNHIINESFVTQKHLFSMWTGYSSVLLIIFLLELLMFAWSLGFIICDSKPIPDIFIISASIIQFLLYVFPPIFLTSTPKSAGYLGYDKLIVNIVSYNSIYFLGYIPLALITAILLIQIFKKKVHIIISLVLVIAYFILSATGLIIKKNSEEEITLVTCRVNMHNLLYSSGNIKDMHTYYDGLSFHLEKAKNENYFFLSDEKQELITYSNFLKDYPIDKIDCILSPCYDLDNKISEYKASAEALIQLLNDLYLNEKRVNAVNFENVLETYKTKKSALENKLIEITNIPDLYVMFYADDVFDLSEHLLLLAKETNSPFIPKIDKTEIRSRIVTPKNTLSELETQNDTTSTAYIYENLFGTKCIRIDRDCTGCGSDFKYVIFNKEIEPIYNKYDLGNYEFCDVNRILWW